MLLGLGIFLAHFAALGEVADTGGGKGWAVLKRKLKRNRTPGVRFHEIIAVTGTGEGEAAQKPRIVFFLAQRKKTEGDKYIRATTNVPLCRQLNSHTV